MPSISEAIRQKKFSSEYHKLAVNILYTSGWIYTLNAENLKKFGITPEQFNILRILRGQHPKPATVSLLTERMLDKKSNASRLVDKLVIKKMADRKTCPEDRRAVDVVITKKGLQLLETIDQQIPVWEKALTSLTKSEASLLNKLLDKLRG